MRKRILCYGDSNTYGTPPMEKLDEYPNRFGSQIRWPGVVRHSLETECELIEEGLPGRTTIHCDPIEGDHLNGLAVLPAILGSHRPIDIVVILLGTNDLKHRFGLTTTDIALSIRRLIRFVRDSDFGEALKAPDVLAIVPPPILECGCLAEMFLGGGKKSRRLAETVIPFLEADKIPFLDAGGIIESSPVDGVHFDSSTQRDLGREVTRALRRMIS